MKTMTPMIVAKKMAGKVDSMLQRLLLASRHNAIAYATER
jgi:hypothetical protein